MKTNELGHVLERRSLGDYKCLKCELCGEQWASSYAPERLIELENEPCLVQLDREIARASMESYEFIRTNKWNFDNGVIISAEAEETAVLEMERLQQNWQKTCEAKYSVQLARSKK